MLLCVLRSFLSYFLSIKVDLEVLVYLKLSQSLLVPAGGVFTTSLKNSFALNWFSVTSVWQNYIHNSFWDTPLYMFIRNYHSGFWGTLPLTLQDMPLSSWDDLPSTILILSDVLIKDIIAMPLICFGFFFFLFSSQAESQTFLWLVMMKSFVFQLNKFFSLNTSKFCLHFGGIFFFSECLSYSVLSNRSKNN